MDARLPLVRGMLMEAVCVLFIVFTQFNVPGETFKKLVRCFSVLG